MDYIVDNIDEYDIEEYCENEELHAVRQELRERGIEPNF